MVSLFLFLAIAFLSFAGVTSFFSLADSAQEVISQEKAEKSDLRSKSVESKTTNTFVQKIESGFEVNQAFVRRARTKKIAFCDYLGRNFNVKNERKVEAPF